MSRGAKKKEKGEEKEVARLDSRYKSYFRAYARIVYESALFYSEPTVFASPKTRINDGIRAVRGLDISLRDNVSRSHLSARFPTSIYIYI